MRACWWVGRLISPRAMVVLVRRHLIRRRPRRANGAASAAARPSAPVAVATALRPVSVLRRYRSAASGAEPSERPQQRPAPARNTNCSTVTGRTKVNVALFVEGELLPTEGPILALRLVVHRDVRRYAADRRPGAGQITSKRSRNGALVCVPVSVLCGHRASPRLTEFPGQPWSGKALQPALRRTNIGCATGARCGVCESHATSLVAQVSS